MAPKYPIVDPAPSLDTVTANFTAGDYATWFGVTAVSVPLGYMAGKMRLWMLVECIRSCYNHKGV